MAQLDFGFTSSDEPAPQWIEDLICEMEAQDLINAREPIAIIVMQPEWPDPVARVQRRIAEEAARN